MTEEAACWCCVPDPAAAAVDVHNACVLCVERVCKELHAAQQVAALGASQLHMPRKSHRH